MCHFIRFRILGVKERTNAKNGDGRNAFFRSTAGRVTNYKRTGNVGIRAQQVSRKK
jgi:hypothetical protein